MLTSCGFLDAVRGIPETQLAVIDDAWSFSDGALSLDLSKLPELADLGGAVRIEGVTLVDSILVVF